MGHFNPGIHTAVKRQSILVFENTRSHGADAEEMARHLVVSAALS